MIDQDLPALLFSLGGPFRQELADLRDDLRSRGAPLVLLNDAAQAGPAAENECSITLPEDLPEWLSPLVAILPGQLLAYHLSLARGFDPDQPRTLRKVTRTF
jgi:glutamine---fructose-6-phosphate transaminase (isomerizing)